MPPPTEQAPLCADRLLRQQPLYWAYVSSFCVLFSTGDFSVSCRPNFVCTNIWLYSPLLDLVSMLRYILPSIPKWSITSEDSCISCLSVGSCSNHSYHSNWMGSIRVWLWRDRSVCEDWQWLAISDPPRGPRYVEKKFSNLNTLKT